MTDAKETSSFPNWALQPRKETGATSFINKFPEYDGRGVVIAIFDSGVDPAAGGLQVTSDGRPKLIDRIDGSGAGDVDTSTVVTVKDAKVTGLTGRTLHVPESWVNPSGKFHIGSKKAFDLYPRGLKDRILTERQEKFWDPGHKKAQAVAGKKLQESEKDKEKDKDKDGDKETLEEKLKREDIEAEVELAASIDKKFRDNSTNHWLADTGPVYDCLVWHNGNRWQAAIDVSEEGDLSSALVLGVYRETREYGRLSEMDQINVSVNIYDEGNLLVIVSMPSSHGTHVASIAAACFPDDPDRNGLAPGAQIVSVTIGDSRLSSMETGTALARAMTHVMRQEHYRVDLINMSYGEHSHWSSSGRVGDLMNEVINKHGVTWVASAGNDGPALCTVGTPPDISTSAVIGVGAYVSPEMMTAMYSTREKLPGTPYTWTSRGPTIDGDRGVCVCAPGGAITSVPQFTLRGTQLMNGTSMASPHTCGALALVMSGLRARGVAWSPYSIKRALENSSTQLENLCHYGQGNGLLSVEKAFNHSHDNAGNMERDVRFAVSCNSNGGKGIHLRGAAAEKAKEIPVKVEPIFLNPDERAANEKLDFNMKFVLTCSASWVSCPSHLDLMYTNRHFLVHVDPTGLPPGAHHTYIEAHDAHNPGKGKVWEVAINVIRAEQLELNPRPHVKHVNLFKPGTIKRHFLPVPSGATWAVFHIKNLAKGQPGKFVLHTVQLLPKLVVRTMEHQKMFSLAEDGGEFQHAIPVKGGQGNVIEVCLAKWWANLGNIETEYTVTFYGLLPNPSQLVMHGGEGVYRLDLEGSLHQEDACPEIKLKHSVQVLRPSGDVKIVTLGDRDVIPVQRHTYELQLTYTFTVAKATEVTPNLSLLSDVLYESEYESQLWMLYDSNKQLVSCGDAYPSKWAAKLEKGDYTCRVHVRHERREALEKIQDMSLLVSSKLPSAVSPDIYSSFTQASVCGKKCNTLNVSPGRSTPVYIAPLSSDKHSKGASLGQYLSGTATFAKDEMGKKADVYTFKYMLPEAPKKKDKSKERESKKSKTDELKAFNEAVRETKVTWLAKLPAQTKEAKDLYLELCSDGGNVSAVHAARLTALDKEDKDWNELLSTAEKLVSSIEQTELLAWQGTKTDTRDNAGEVKKDMEKQRGQLLEALAAKGTAIIDGNVGSKDDLPQIYSTILKFTDAGDAKVVNFMVKHAELGGQFARALKLVMKQMEDKPSKELEKKAGALMKSLGWDHAAWFNERAFPAHYPNDFQPF